MKKIKFTFLILSALFFIIQSKSNANAQNIKSQGPGTYKILNKNDTPVQIPFRMHNGKPVLDVEINGKKAALMIDNGILWNEVWLFGTALVSDLELKAEQEGSIGGAGEGDPTQAYYSSTNISIKFDEIIFYEQPVLVSPAAAGFSKMFPGTDGQLCNTFFKHFIVELDFINNVIFLHQPDKFKPYKNGCELPMTLNESGTHAVPFSIITTDGKEFNDKTDIDFGGIYEFKVALNNGNNIQVPDNAEEVIGYGAQGKITSYKGKLQSMKLGKYKFVNPVVVLGDEGTSRIHPGNLGVIGLPMFMKFNVAFDYFNNKIYLEPNSTFDGTIEIDL